MCTYIWYALGFHMQLKLFTSWKMVLRWRLPRADHSQCRRHRSFIQDFKHKWPFVLVNVARAEPFTSYTFTVCEPNVNRMMLNHFIALLLLHDSRDTFSDSNLFDSFFFRGRKIISEPHWNVSAIHFLSLKKQNRNLKFRVRMRQCFQYFEMKIPKSHKNKHP